MNRFPLHRSPSPEIVAKLLDAGVSWSTAMAMEGWKAREVLDLLRPEVTNELPKRPGGSGPARGKL